MSDFKINVSDYKTAGVYVEEIDNSIVNYRTTQSALRLAVGFNGKAPFNRPIYIANSKDVNTFLGPIDKRLERKGCFSNRSVRKMIEKEPVFFLNLLNVDSSDNVGYCFPVVANKSTFDASAFDTSLTPYATLFDRSNFWVADDDAFVKNVFANGNVEDVPESNFFGFGNCGTSDISVFIRKAEKLSGYDITLSEWYGGDDKIPYKWVSPTDLVSDYFVQVVAISGKWNDFESLAADPYWKKYLDADGIKKDMFDKFLKLDSVTVLGNWTGCIFPEFYDKRGAIRSIGYLVNSNTNGTGLMMGVNADAMDAYTLDSSATGIASYSVNGKHVTDTRMPDFTTVITGSSASVLGNGRLGSFILGGATPFYKNLSYSKFDASVFASNILDVSTGVVVDSSSCIAVVDSSMYTPGVMDYVRTADGATARIYKVRTIDASTKKIYAYNSVRTDSSAGSTKAEFHVDVRNAYTHLKPFSLDGLEIKAKHMPGFDKNGNPNNEAGVEKIYSMLTEDSGIKKGLLNDQLIDFRYIVDTMAYGLGDNAGAKNHLAVSAARKKHCLALCNVPSMTQFSRLPQYNTSDTMPIFNVKYIPEEGNQDKILSADASIFTLPSEDDAAKHSAFFAPFLKYQSGSTVLLVPPAANVSNVFMNKYHGGDPYKAVANLNGVIEDADVIGLEYLFDEEDRGYIEPFGINPIITEGGVIKIYGDQTAYQRVNSDLSKIHARELLNTIAINCRNILKDYVFSYNVATTRSEIITRLDPMFSAMMSSDALVRYDVQCDDINNTKELIDNKFCLVEISVWMSQCMEKIVVPISVNRSTTA